MYYFSGFRYIDRNVDELEQIELKHMIGGRISQSRQHASREDSIRITREREMQQFTESGFGKMCCLLMYTNTPQYADQPLRNHWYYFTNIVMSR